MTFIYCDNFVVSGKLWDHSMGTYWRKMHCSFIWLINPRKWSRKIQFCEVMLPWRRNTKTTFSFSHLSLHVFFIHIQILTSSSLSMFSPPHSELSWK
jgi:hypothetical protein